MTRPVDSVSLCRSRHHVALSGDRGVKGEVLLALLLMLRLGLATISSCWCVDSLPLLLGYHLLERRETGRLGGGLLFNLEAEVKREREERERQWGPQHWAAD